MPAARDREARDLGEAACDEPGARIMAEAHSVGDASRDRDHIFERATELDADHIFGAVDTKAIGPERILYVFRRLFVFARDADGGGDALRDLFSEARSAQKSEPSMALARELILKNFGDELERSLFNALGRADNRDALGDERRGGAERLAEANSRHDDDEHLGVLKRDIELMRRV